MLVIGLTGSIGMGKTATAGIFRGHGAPVYESDLAVHRAYAGIGRNLVAKEFPDAVVDGYIDRAKLADLVLLDPTLLNKLEMIVHPLIRTDRSEFVRSHYAAGAALIVLDIPLLFEAKCESEVDLIVVVDAPETVQKSRVMSRPGMTSTKFEAILAKQMSSEEKKRRAHMVIDTSHGLEYVDRQVVSLIRSLSNMTGVTSAGRHRA